MSRTAIKNGIICGVSENDRLAGSFSAIYHLTEKGDISAVNSPPQLSKGEGLFMISGEFYAEPLEIQIDFLKSESSEEWLEAVFLRHAERVRSLDESVSVIAEIKEAGA